MGQPLETQRAAMRAAYLNQTINLLVTVLMVPLLLRYLDVDDYVLWSIFTTFGGVTLQLESAIQTVSVREIAREYNAGNALTLKAAIQKAKAAYTTLSASVLVPLLAVGLLYLRSVARGKLGNQGETEWLLFVLAYAFNYYMGTNNTILLGMARVARFNNTTSLTRLLYFLGAYALLKAGFGILGLCTSFAASVVTGCVLILLAARETLTDHFALPESHSRPDAQFEYSQSTNIMKYTLFMLAAFSLYRGGVLIATSLLPKEVVGAYALTLQASAMLSALAIVPVQVWLNRLVKAVTSGNQQEMVRELTLTVAVANAIFVVGATAFVLLGDTLLGLIGAKVVLGSRITTLLVCLAFLVELNIFLLSTFLVTRHNYRFVMVYVVSCVLSAGIFVLLLSVTKPSVLTLVAAPLVSQSLLCLPLIFRMTCLELGTSPSQLIRHLRLSAPPIST